MPTLSKFPIILKTPTQAALEPMGADEIYDLHTTYGNLNQLVLDGEPRTNNGIEAFNKQFAKNVGAAHPTIWKLIDAMRREVLLTEQR